MTKTNNLNELPDTKELWLDLGNDIIIQVSYDNEKQIWQEGISQKKDKIKIVFDTDKETNEAHYLWYAISCYKAFARKGEFSEEFVFADRNMVFGYAKDWKDYITIQTGQEDKEGNYNCELINIKKEKWLEIAEFFEKVSILFMNRENLNQRDIEDGD
jgi:hypothetical protein